MTHAVKKQYGAEGYNSYLKLEEGLGKLSKGIKLQYNAETKKFTILNGSEFTLEKIAEAFKGVEFHAWQPEFSSGTINGNRLVRLVPIYPDIKHSQKAIGVVVPSHL